MSHQNENPSDQKSQQSADRATQTIMALAWSFPCLRIKIDEYHPQSFDPDTFWRLMRGASSGERLCALFVLNVWNPAYAARKGWRFDFFEFAVTGRFHQPRTGQRLAYLSHLAVKLMPFPYNINENDFATFAAPFQENSTMNTYSKKTERELRALLRGAKLIHDWAHITPERKMGDKIFKATDGTIIAEIWDSSNRREPYPLIELNQQQYRATVEVNAWMPDACAARQGNGGKG